MKFRINKTVGGIAAAGLAMVAIGASMSPASADPIGAPTYRSLAGIGSDTTFNVLNGLSEVVQIGGVKQIGSYDPIPTGRLISTKAAANCQNLVSPNGSGAGRTKLLESLTPGNAIEGCYDFSRSSSLTVTPVAAATGGLTYVPFAQEAYSYAVRTNSTIPVDLTLADVQSIYRCEVPGLVPYIPQSGSGSRATWLGYMGISEAQVTGTYTCIKDVKAGQGVQENDPRLLTKNNEIMPMSVANYVAMSNGYQTDNRSTSVLGNLDAKPQIGTGSGQTLVRKVYNVIPTTKEATAPWSTVFVGGSSLICQNSDTIAKYGFSPLAGAACGTVTDKAPPTAP